MFDALASVDTTILLSKAEEKSPGLIFRMVRYSLCSHHLRCLVFLCDVLRLIVEWDVVWSDAILYVCSVSIITLSRFST